jgi:GT2 family glycosyltransferase
MTQPEISLIIVNHQTAGEVRNLLNSLEKFAPSLTYEVLVVNTVPEGAFARRESDSLVQVLQMDSNRGFGSAVNRGILAATGKYLMFMNADLLFTDDCLPRLVAEMNNIPEIGILAPQLVLPDGSLQYNARTFYTFFTVLCRRTPLGRFFSDRVKRHLMMDKDHNESFSADWVMGAAAVARRELLAEGKLFDERYFLYFEDVDLCLRTWIAGYFVEYFPQAKLIHAHRRESAARPWSRQGRAHLASWWKFWRKWW